MKCKRLLTAVFSMVLSVCMMTSGVSAASVGTVIDGSTLTGANSSTISVFLVEDSSIEFGTPAITSEPVFPVAGSESTIIGDGSAGTPYGYYLATGGCTITRLDDCIAGVEGYTNCYRTAEYVYLGIYMDRLEDGCWHTVWYKEVSAENAYSLSYSVNVLVKEGYYYRLRAAHSAQTGDTREANTSFTNGVAFGTVS